MRIRQRRRVDSGRAERPAALDRAVAVADAAVSGAEIRVFGACPCFRRLPCGVRGRAPAAMLSNRIVIRRLKLVVVKSCGFTTRKADESGTVTAGERRGLVAPALSLHHTLNTALVAAGCAAVPQPSPCGPLRGSA